MPLSYIKRLLLGLDQFGNTLIGGYPDETISAHAGRLKNKPTLTSKLWWSPLSAILNGIEHNHVEKAILHEEDGEQQDPFYHDVYDPDDITVRLTRGDCDV